MNRRAFALFTAAFLLTLIATAPAALLDSLLRSASKNRLALANAEGFVWHGRATLAAHTTDNSFTSLLPISWNIAFLPLFTGALKAQFQLNDSSQSEITATPARIELRHVDFSAPAEILDALSPILKTAQLHGRITVHCDQMAIGGNAVEGVARIDWKEAGSGLSRVSPLGDYRITLNGQGADINIALATTGGALLLEGVGNFSDGHLALHGTARAAPESYDGLSALLHNLGPETAPHVHSFNFQPN